MKILLGSLLMLSVLVGVPSVAFADHTEVTIEAATGSGAPGCEETAEGCYLPSTATVDVGGVVIFSNPDSAAHTFTSGDPTMPDTVQALFDSSLVMAGSTYEWSPTEAGDVPYFCMVHPWMQGVIIVQEAGAEEDIYVDLDHNIIGGTVTEMDNQKLKNKIIDLKLENRQLKNQITSLNSEIESLKDQIVSMTKEFVSALQQLTQWFGEKISSNN